ncbi:MAG TPA: ribbon-helix-helix domain-containing protein [Candidatus Ruania gallistercoris]|uniref:Ribbon-helix-helix domain-containing protein n=1 Tax=Candidatus Ruania gallistercoris TaxID=2838746 RepID=A0A9D2J5W1_9MICO|nr:ribbon-helix-helix domain-containing protein [Candidatus Ruania gallistercoris]
MQRTTIYLDEEQTAALDELAADQGVSRAEIIRRLLAEGLAGRTRDVTVDLAWIEASFGVAEIAAPDRGPGAPEHQLDQLPELDR